MRTLGEQGNGAATLRTVLGALQHGETLSRAMQATGAFGVPLLACAKASELTGDLGDSLQRFAANAARLRTPRSRLVSACVYPALLVGVTFLVVLFLLVYVVPRFALVLDNAVQDIARCCRACSSSSARRCTACRGPIWIALALALGAGAWGVAPARAGQLSAWLLQQTVRLPWMRPYVRSFGLSQLARSGAMLIRSGIPALKALGMCRELVAIGDREALDRALAAAATGTPLAQSLHEAGLLDALTWRVLRVSEATGQLHARARPRGRRARRAARARPERLGRLIEPILMLAIGSVVGGIVVLMYVPIFQMASSIR